jgi:MFS transporter, FHS family, glucose/mannose:H+ symporter
MMMILCGIQLLSGMILVLLSPALGDVLASLHVSETEGGTLFMVYFLGGTVSTLAISWLPRLLSTRRILQGSMLLAGAGLWGFSQTQVMGTAGLCYLFVGAANAVLVAFPGALLARRYREGSGRAMSFLYTFFALGVMCCPSASGFLLHRGIPWQWTFQGMALACLVFAFLTGLCSLPSMEGGDGLSWRSLREARAGDRGLLVGAILLNILYIGGETSVMGWVVYYLQKVYAGETNVFRASRVLTYFWLLMILGRILTALVVERAGSFRTLLALVSGGILAWGGAMFARELLWSEALFALTGLFFSGLFPVIASLAGRFPERHTGLAFSVILAGGGAGGAFFPFLVGWLAEKKSLQFGLGSAISSLVLMWFLLWNLRGRGANV